MEAFTLLFITLTIAPAPTPAPFEALEKLNAPARFLLLKLLLATTSTSPVELTVELSIVALIVLLITSVAIAPEKLYPFAVLAITLPPTPTEIKSSVF